MITTEWTRLGHAGPDAYVATPSRPQGAVVVVPEMFGVNPYARSICDRLAAEGYVAVTPDIYWRQGRLADLGYDEDSRQEGFRLMHTVRRDEVLADIAAARACAVSRAAESARTAILGFSLGGHIALLAATESRFDLAVVFYPGWTLHGGIPLADPRPPLADAARLAANGTYVLGFNGADDHLISPEEWTGVETRLTAAGVPHELIAYPGVGHGFFCDDRPKTYVPEAAADAWPRLLTALAKP